MGLSRRRAEWIVLLSIIGGLGTPAPSLAGPVVSHALATAPEPAAEQGGNEGSLAALLSPPEPSTSPGTPAPVSLNDLGYPTSLTSAASATGINNRLIAPLLSSPAGDSSLSWSIPTPPTRTTALTQISNIPKARIPEPASIILLVTGLLGLLARRRILRARDVSR